MRPTKTLGGGFTLIAPMIVLAIGALLPALTLPSHNDSVHRGRRSGAAAIVVGVMHAQERWRGPNPSDSDSMTLLNSGSNFRVGRFQYPVAESLDSQNDLITDTASCPTVNSLSTTEHQVCSNGNAQRDTDCPAS